MNQSIIDKDLDYIWHPCTQMKDHETLPLIPIKSDKLLMIEQLWT